MQAESMTRHSPFYILRVDLGECRRTEQDWPIRPWVGPEGLVDRILGAEGNGRFSGGQGLGKGTTRDWWLGLTGTGS